MAKKEERTKIIDNSGDEKHFILHYFKEKHLLLFKAWLKENMYCSSCKNRCLEKGWNDKEIEKIYNIIKKII